MKLGIPLTPIYCILGQTATGKTQRAIDIAREQSGAVLNADSRQIYKHMDVVTGKTDYRDGYLFDLVEPGEPFSSHDYVNEAQKTIQKLSQENILPVLVGGTGHYVRHLLYGFDVVVGPDAQLRSQLQDKTVDELQHELITRGGEPVLRKMNPSDRANPMRLIRKIEIVKAGDKKMTGAHISLYNPTIEVYLHQDRDVMRDKIAARIDARLDAGAIEECEKLLKSGPGTISLCLKTIGYKSLISYIRGEIDLTSAKARWLRDEMRYAKAQSTYFRKYFPPCKCAYFSVS